MNVLLIDCSSKRTGFAFAEDSLILEEHYLNREYNADSLIYFIKQAFFNKKTTNALDFIAVNNGPGSFTGLRVGLAAAKAFCLTLDSKLILLNSLDVLANTSNAYEASAAIDAKMKGGFFYFCRFKRESGLLKPVENYSIVHANEIGELEVITNEASALLTNEIVSENNFYSMLKLALEKINLNLFDDVESSEPFYLQDFKIKT